MNLSEEATKKVVIELSGKGNSYAKIGEALGIPKSTVGDFLSRNTYTDWWDSYDGGVGTAAGAKVLLHDIETAATKAYVWSRFKQNIGQSQVIREGYVLTWSAQWLGEEEILWDALDQYEDYDPSDVEENDQKVVESLWKLYDEADIVVAHNAPFDTKVMNARFAYWGLNPPSPYKIGRASCRERV